MEGERLTAVGEGAHVDVLDRPEAGGAAIRGGGLRVAGYVAGVGLALASIPLLTRHLGVADFGRYTLILSIIGMIQGLSEGGLVAVGMREYAVLSAAERARMMPDLLGLRLVLTTAGVAGAVLFTVAAGYDETIVVGTVLAGAGLLLWVMFTLLSVPLQASLRFGWVTVAELLRQAVTALLIVALVIAGAGLLPFVAVQIPAAFAAFAIAVALARHLVPLRPAFRWAPWVELIRETLPYAIAVAVAAVYFRIVVVLLSLVSTEVETGYFSASYRVIEVLVGIPVLLVGAAFPVLSRAARDDADRLLYAGQRTFDLMVMLGLWLTLSVALGAGFMIDVIGGAEFEDAVPVLRVQAFAVVCTFVTVSCGFMLLSLRRHRAILLATLVPLAFGVALTLALAPSEGALGAAIATVAAETGFAIAALLAVRTNRTPDRVPLSLRIFAPAAAAAALAVLVELLFPDIHEVITVTVASIVYFAALAALGQIPPELRGALRERLARG